MSIFSRLFGRKKEADKVRVGGMEDFMTMIRVYYQATMAAQLGITNLALLPELRIFKQTLRVPTVNNKLGVGERTRCRKEMMGTWGMSEEFFKQIDASVKHKCRSMNDVKQYFELFQGFSSDLMMLLGNLMQWKLRMPSMFHKALKNMTTKTVHDIFTKNDWSDASVARTCMNIRKYSQMLAFDEAWTNEYVYTLVTLAKKEPAPSAANDK